MSVGDFRESVEESKDYLEQANEAGHRGNYLEAGWNGGMAIGNTEGAVIGAGAGAYTGFLVAEPVYQAVEAVVPEAAPWVRLLGYSAPIAKISLTGMLTYEGTRMGLPAGKYVGRYGGGSVGAGLMAVGQGFREIQEYLEGTTQ